MLIQTDTDWRLVVSYSIILENTMPSNISNIPKLPKLLLFLLAYFLVLDHIYFRPINGRVPTPLPKIARAVIINGMSAV